MNYDAIAHNIWKIIRARFDEKKAKGLTKTKLSILTGYGISTLTDFLEHEKGTNDLQKIAILCENLGLDIGEVIREAYERAC